MGYIDGNSMYPYTGANPIASQDATGQFAIALDFYRVHHKLYRNNNFAVHEHLATWSIEGRVTCPSGRAENGWIVQFNTKAIRISECVSGNSQEFVDQGYEAWRYVSRTNTITIDGTTRSRGDTYFDKVKIEGENASPLHALGAVNIGEMRFFCDSELAGKRNTPDTWRPGGWPPSGDLPSFPIKNPSQALAWFHSDGQVVAHREFTTVITHCMRPTYQYFARGETNLDGRRHTRFLSE